MIRQLVLGSLCIGALVGPGGDALANGRPPQTSTISFRKGMENQIAAGTAFGLVRSNDNGATWHWVCEDAIGYGGMYDPDYIYASTGTLFATTFDGLVVNRDGCTFEKSSLSPPPPISSSSRRSRRAPPTRSWPRPPIRSTARSTEAPTTA